MTIAEAAKVIRFHLDRPRAEALLARVQRRVRPGDDADAYLRALREEMLAARLIRPEQWP